MLGDFCQNIINDTNDQILEKQEDLKFVSDFFDTYIKTKLNEDLEVEEPKKYNVFLLNDDYSTMDFVIDVLVKVFRKNQTIS
ncbi:hypothetical protein AS859_11395 [Aliarcobacter cryaerophilus]|uniref:Adaptor protein ClpS core domain-containing protein n=1 Tax=Aliarcobacter cryaerophilus TaxID=28198 RepID=A0A1V9V9L1_9BACT|nr:hypothetical protein AS859_11395 [Aliarcobacter cryaerophilus]